MDPDAPWWANTIMAIIVAGIAALGTYFASRRSTKGIRDQVVEIKEQVKNSHTDSNLREDIDEIKNLAADALAEAKMAKESSHRSERYTEDLSSSIRSIEHSLDRRTNEQARALAGAVKDRERALADLAESIPEMIKSEIGKHELRCRGFIKPAD